MKQEIPNHIIPSGKFKGQPIDARTRHSISIQSEDSDFIVVDYFFHEGIFHTAKIPKNSVKEIRGQRFSFSRYNPFVNHAQVRITLKDDKLIELYPLGETGKATHQIKDFTYSVEVVGPKGKAWSFLTAFGDFVSAHRVLSTEEVVFERVTLGNYQVIQSPPIKLNEEMRNRALEIMIKRSSDAGMNQMYYLFNLSLGANNCTSEVFSILDQLIGNEYNFFQRFISRLLWRFPVALRFYLRLRGAIDHRIRAMNLNEEFRNLARSDAFVQRKKQIKRSLTQKTQ